MHLVVMFLLVAAFLAWAIMVLIAHMMIAVLAESARHFWDRRAPLIERAVSIMSWPAEIGLSLADGLFVAVRRRL